MSVAVGEKKKVCGDLVLNETPRTPGDIQLWGWCGGPSRPCSFPQHPSVKALMTPSRIYPEPLKPLFSWKLWWAILWGAGRQLRRINLPTWATAEEALGFHPKPTGMKWWGRGAQTHCVLIRISDPDCWKFASTEVCWPDLAWPRPQVQPLGSSEKKEEK